MPVALEDYIDLEEGVARYLYRLWEREAEPKVAAMEKAFEDGDYDSVIRMIRDIDVQSIAQEAEKGLRNHAIMSLTYGSMLATETDKTAYTNEALPPVVDAAVESYQESFLWLQDRLIDSIARIVVAKADTKPIQPHLCASGHHHTFDLAEVIMKASELTAAEKLNAVVMGQARGAIETAANLNTSRLVGLGFLDQQRREGVTVYQISAVLDGRVCPVCQTMHGKTFSVASGFARLTKLLTTTDPAVLKAVAPFPSQRKAAIAELRSMDSAKLEANGMGTPPYHPACRCRQVAIGTVPASEILPVIPKQPDVAQPTTSGGGALSDEEKFKVIRGTKPSSFNAYEGDRWLLDYQKKTGGGGRILVKDFTDEDMAEPLLFRGVYNQDQLAAELAGERLGQGVSGNGMYFSSGTAWSDAFHYTSFFNRPDTGGMIVARLKPGARVITAKELHKLQYPFVKGIMDQHAWDIVGEFAMDDGRYAAFLGYDAIKTEVRDGGYHYIVVNTGALEVDKASFVQSIAADTTLAARLKKEADRLNAKIEELTAGMMKARANEDYDTFVKMQNAYFDARQKYKNIEYHNDDLGHKVELFFRDRYGLNE